MFVDLAVHRVPKMSRIGGVGGVRPDLSRSLHRAFYTGTETAILFDQSFFESQRLGHVTQWLRWRSHLRLTIVGCKFFPSSLSTWFAK